MLKTALLITACVCNFGAVYARTEAQIRTWFVEVGIECNKDHSLNGEDISMLAGYQMPESENVHCFLACVYKKVNWLNHKSMFDHEGAITMLEKEQLDNPKKLEDAKNVVEECKKVNDVALESDENGCKRAALLGKCLFEVYPKYNLNL